MRNLTARCLVAAGRVLAADTQSASLPHADDVKNDETSASSSVEAVTQLSGELKTTLTELSATYARQTTNQVNKN